MTRKQFRKLVTAVHESALPYQAVATNDEQAYVSYKANSSNKYLHGLLQRDEGGVSFRVLETNYRPSYAPGKIHKDWSSENFLPATAGLQVEIGGIRTGDIVVVLAGSFSASSVAFAPDDRYFGIGQGNILINCQPGWPFHDHFNGEAVGEAFEEMCGVQPGGPRKMYKRYRIL